MPLFNSNGETTRREIYTKNQAFTVTEAPDVTYPADRPETVEIDGLTYTVEYGYGGVLAYHPEATNAYTAANPWSGYWDADGYWVE